VNAPKTIADLFKQTNSMRAGEAIRTTETLLTLFHGASATAQAAMGVGVLALFAEIRRLVADQEELGAYLDYLDRPDIKHDMSQLRSIVTGNSLPPAARQNETKTKL
jgi:hypothetical protein